MSRVPDYDIEALSADAAQDTSGHVLAERLLMRFLDGPLRGDRLMEREWPLPDLIPSPDGRGSYVKVQESQLPAPQPGVLRGAEYRWSEAPE